MLCFTTPKHHTFITVSGINGDSTMSVEAYAQSIDKLIDDTLQQVRADHQLPAVVREAATLTAAITHLWPSVQHAARLNGTHADQDLTQRIATRVAYLLHPTGWRFARYGWIH